MIASTLQVLDMIYTKLDRQGCSKAGSNDAAPKTYVGGAYVIRHSLPSFVRC